MLRFLLKQQGKTNLRLHNLLQNSVQSIVHGTFDDSLRVGTILEGLLDGYVQVLISFVSRQVLQKMAPLELNWWYLLQRTNNHVKLGVNLHNLVSLINNGKRRNSSVNHQIERLNERHILRSYSNVFISTNCWQVSQCFI